MVEELEQSQAAQTPEEWFGGHTKALGSPKISHALLRAASNIEDALAKASLRDQAELNSLLFLLAELEVHGLTVASPPPLNTVPRMVMRRLIGSSSIFGKARFEAIESDIQILDQAAHQSFITGRPVRTSDLKTKRGFFKKNQQNNEYEASDGQ